MTSDSNSLPVSGPRVAALAVACGLAVATLYYSQPLLPAMAAAVGSGASAQGAITMLTQIGYALGLLLFGPLSDRLDQRRLVACLIPANIAGLMLSATASSLAWLLAASMLVGVTGVAAQIIIPAVSGLVAPAKRGHTVGCLMSGLFAGTLFARTLSGYVGEHAGWRTMFALAAVIDVLLFVVVWLCLPAIRPSSDMSYSELMVSLGLLFVRQPLLREACLAGFLLFGALNVLWGSLALMLQRPPYGWGSDLTGLFGFVGLAGMLASTKIGRLSDHWGARNVVSIAATLVILAFSLIAASGYCLALLVLGVIGLDLGSRANLIANQTRLYGLQPEVRGRLNTVFMISYYVGGAIGSIAGATVAGRYGWIGLGVAGGTCGALALVAAHLAHLSEPVRVSRDQSHG
ncbi:MFS transporter [Paraburkholderia sp. HP33-1]|uniref:MFS transporter n=1 Tax=Paraburkholderia sp. HP33-1 TaxID=2883243 RepID=UPI001F28FE27|nr:MFS transporter [Paraburkholderia sp. HP33-1]